MVVAQHPLLVGEHLAVHLLGLTVTTTLVNRSGEGMPGSKTSGMIAAKPRPRSHGCVSKLFSGRVVPATHKSDGSSVADTHQVSKSGSGHVGDQPFQQGQYVRDKAAPGRPVSRAPVVKPG